MFYKCPHEGRVAGVQNTRLVNALGNNDREVGVLCQQRTLCFIDIFIILGRVI